jgi:DNA polymerase V
MDWPLFLWRVAAGFPSPAEDWLEQRLDLNTFLIAHPAATFFVYVRGDSMRGAGIHQGDLLIVDRAVEARHNHVIVAVLDGEFTVKRLQIVRGKVILKAEHPDYSPLEVSASSDFQVWGVVTFVIHPLLSFSASPNKRMP